MQPTSIEIIKTLKKAGHEAYWAGGCVRDILLGIKPKDFDIVTDAKPEEIEKLLETTRERGLTVIPTKLYLKNGLIKVELAVGRGKKLHDKRESEREREMKAEARAALGRRT